jgi:hypothetical protein
VRATKRREGIALPLGFFACSIVVLLAWEYFGHSMRVDCSCRHTERLWPFQLVNLLAATSIGAVLFDGWRRIVARWMEPKEGTDDR